MSKTIGEDDKKEEIAEIEDELQTLDLEKPINNMGSEISTLTFKPPTNKQYLAFKTPFLLIEGTVDPLPARVVKYLPECCNLAEAAVDQMAPGDIMMAGIILAGFFGGSASATEKNQTPQKA